MEPGVTEIAEVDLAPLGLDAAVQLARSLRRSLARITATELARRSGGNPYYVGELVLHVASGGDLGPQAPADLDEALRARIARLSDERSVLLRVVAIAGGAIDEDVALRTAEIPAGNAASAVEALRAERLLRSEGGALDTFHERVRTAVLDRLDPDSTRRLHGRLAIVLLAAGVTNPDVLVEHFRAAENPEREAEFALAAADKAEQTLAFGRAADLYGRAIGLGVGGADELRALGLKRAEVLTRAGRWGEAADVRLELAKDASASLALTLRTTAAEQLLCSGRFEDGTRELEEVLRSMRIYVPASPWTALLALLGVRILLALRRTRPTPRPGGFTPEQRARFDVMVSAGSGFAMTDNVRGQYFQARAVLGALGGGYPAGLERAIFMETCFSATGGRSSERRSRALMALSRQVAERSPTRYSESFREGSEAFVAFFLGRFDAARIHAARAEELCQNLAGETFFVNWARSMECRALTFLGHLTELRRRLADARREMQRVGDLLGIANLVSSQSTLHLAADRVDLASEELEAVGGILPARRFLVLHFDHLMAGAQTELYCGRAASASALVERAWPRLRRSLLTRVSIMRLVAWALRGRVRLARASEVVGREREDHLRLVEALARRLGREGYALAEGHCAQLRAGAHAVRGDTASAARHAEQAERAFAAASMKVHGAASRLFRGTLLRGEEGDALTAQATEVLASEGIRRPERFAAMLAPGLRT